MTEHPRLGIIGARGWLGGTIVSVIVPSLVRQAQYLALSYRNGIPRNPAEATSAAAGLRAKRHAPPSKVMSYAIDAVRAGANTLLNTS